MEPHKCNAPSSSPSAAASPNTSPSASNSPSSPWPPRSTCSPRPSPKPPANSTNSAKTRLNPPDLVHRVPEVVPGFPDRILPNDDRAAAILKKRTLTNLYNERPTWLRNAHARLDSAVANAYGLPPDISDNEALAHLLTLNHARAR